MPIVPKMVHVKEDKWEAMKNKPRREAERWTIDEFIDAMLDLYLGNRIELERKDDAPLLPEEKRL